MHDIKDENSSRNYSTLEKLNSGRKAQLLKNDENWKLKSAERLEKIVKKKMETLMIGALAAIEDAFGDLWGDGKPEGDYEERCHKEWLLLRHSILDLGNKQIRALKKELMQYDISWEKYLGIGNFLKEEKNGKD